MPTLNYTQTMEIIEAFMNASDIRKYCTDICKGQCCGECYTSENACHKHEGRRISCSAYVCLPSTDNKARTFFQPFRIAQDIICDVAGKIYDEYQSFTSNRYFRPPPKRLFNEFSIEGKPRRHSVWEGKGTNIGLVKAGLSLSYAAEVKVVINKMTRMAHIIMAKKNPEFHAFKKYQPPKLCSFDLKKEKVKVRWGWKISHWTKC